MFPHNATADIMCLMDCCTSRSSKRCSWLKWKGSTPEPFQTRMGPDLGFNILQLVEDVTTQLSGQRYRAMPLVLPLVLGLCQQSAVKSKQKIPHQLHISRKSWKLNMFRDFTSQWTYTSWSSCPVLCVRYTHLQDSLFWPGTPWRGESTKDHQSSRRTGCEQGIYGNLFQAIKGMINFRVTLSRSSRILERLSADQADY